MEGVQIEVRSENFITSQERRVVSLWESGLKELVTGDNGERQGREKQIFLVTQKGYNYIDNLI